MDCLTLIHNLMESLPQAILQAGAIVVKSVVNNDKQCLYRKPNLEKYIAEKFYMTAREYLSAPHKKSAEFCSRISLDKGSVKKKRVRAGLFICSFVDCFCCFIQTTCINDK